MTKSLFSNDVWIYDFLFEETEDGRTFTLLTLVDEFTRGCLVLEAQRRLNYEDVWISKRIRSDNGS